MSANLSDAVNLKLHFSCALLALAGCSPYASYTHLSDPRVAGDGYDLVCAGGIYRKANFEARTAGCYNAAPLHGEFIKVDISYVWEPRAANLSFAEASEASEQGSDQATRVARTGTSPAGGEL